MRRVYATVLCVVVLTTLMATTSFGLPAVLSPLENNVAEEKNNNNVVVGEEGMLWATATTHHHQSRSLLQGNLDGASLSQASLSAKANFYSDKIVQPILTQIPRVDFGGKVHNGVDLSVAFFTQVAESPSSVTTSCYSPFVRNDTNLYCSYLDFAVIMIAIAVVFPFLTFFAVLFFCSGRLCCRCACCCRNCGGKLPTREYSRLDRMSAWLFYVLGMLLLIAFSLGGFLSMNQIGVDVDSFFTTAISISNLPGDFINQVLNPAIASLTASFVAIFAGVNQRLTGVPTLQSELTNAILGTTQLDAMFDQLKQTASQEGGSCGSTCDPTAVGYARFNLQIVRAQLAAIDLSQIDKPLNVSQVSDNFNNAVSGTQNQLTQISNILQSALGNTLSNPQSQWSKSEGNRVYATYILWGLTWLLVLISIIVLFARKSGGFWCVYCLAFWLLFLYFVIYLILFVPSLVFGDICTVLPTQANGRGSGDIVTITSQLSDPSRTVNIFNQCLLQTGGNFFDAFSIPKSTITNAFSGFNVTNTIPDSAVQANLNSNVYVVPMTVVNTNLTSLHATDMGVASNDAAVLAQLQAMQQASANVLTNMGQMATLSATIRTNITLMRSDSDTQVNSLTAQVVSAASCAPLKTSYESLLTAVCNVSRSMDGIWFSCLLVGFLCIMFLFCNMKAAKRIPAPKVAPRTHNYKGKSAAATKKNRVQPVGSNGLPAVSGAGTEEKKKKKKKKKTKSSKDTAK